MTRQRPPPWPAGKSNWTKRWQPSLVSHQTLCIVSHLPFTSDPVTHPSCWQARERSRREQVWEDKLRTLGNLTPLVVACRSHHSTPTHFAQHRCTAAHTHTHTHTHTRDDDRSLGRDDAPQSAGRCGPICRQNPGRGEPPNQRCTPHTTHTYTHIHNAHYTPHTIHHTLHTHRAHTTHYTLHTTHFALHQTHCAHTRHHTTHHALRTTHYAPHTPHTPQHTLRTTPHTTRSTAHTRAWFSDVPRQHSLTAMYA